MMRVTALCPVRTLDASFSRERCRACTNKICFCLFTEFRFELIVTDAVFIASDRTVDCFIQ